MRKTLLFMTFIMACSSATASHQPARVGMSQPADPPNDENGSTLQNNLGREPEVGSSLPNTLEREPSISRFEAGEALISERGFRGTFIAREVGGSDLLVAFPELVGEALVPASTFKIPNSLIGLETGVITDERFTLPWDGQERQIAAWNRDHDLSSALDESVVWYYQEVARRIGHERMAEWLRRLDYGNATIGSEVDTFWLEGPLLITPREQLEFLERMTSGQLDVSQRSVDILRRVMPGRQAGAATLRAKTGTALRVPGSHAWLVGWVELDNEVTSHFALLLLCEPDSIPSRTMRWELAEQLLRTAQILDGA